MKDTTDTTDFAQAYWDYQETDKHKEGSDPTTLKAPPSQRQFLENRLYWAFCAGWNAATELREADAENLTPSVSKCSPEGSRENRVQGQDSGPSRKNRGCASGEIT